MGRRRAEPSASAGEGRLVAGLQPVREAIRVHGRRLIRVAVDDRPEPRLDAVARFATDQGVERVDRVDRAELDRAGRGTFHQGALAWAPALQLLDESALLAEPALLALALDEIQDPQNFGAVVRSAVALAGAAVVWGEHSSAPLTPATGRASAGAIEHARLCRVRSLPSWLGQASAAGVTVVGLDAQAPRALGELDLRGPTVLVIGGEQSGMRRAVRAACTMTAYLFPMARVDSLNASVAAGIALYEAGIQRAKSSGSSSTLE